MKKILLVGALATAMLANAASLENAQVRNFAKDSRKVEASVLPFEWKDAATMLKEHEAARAPKDASYGLADWYYAPGTFYLGIYEGIGSYNLGMILLPYMDSVTFYNYYGPTDWSMNGTVYAEGTDEYVENFGVNGMYYVPATADHDFNPSRDWGSQYKDTTIQVKGTTYASAANGQYLCSAIEGKYLNDENIHMTLCAMWADPFYEEDGNDFWRVGGAFAGDPYFNGTGVHINGAATTADTLGIIVDNRGLMKIEEILFPIYADNKADSTGLIPDGAQVKVALFPMDELGIHFDDTIASTVMTNADIVGAAVSWGYYGTAHAKFYEQDIFGVLNQVPVYVEGGFYLQLTNFNETGCDFGFFSDYDCSTTATTVYQHDGQFSFRGHTKAGGGQYGQNLGISFDAYFPTIINDTTTNEMNAAVEEGYAFYGNDPENQVAWLLSNVNYEDWGYEGDEWIEPVIATADYWEDYSVLGVAFAVQALPEGVTGRTGTITFNADGAELTFTIYQGEGMGVPTVKEGRFDNKSYDVLGREIKDANFKGVVIRNGQKTLK